MAIQVVPAETLPASSAEPSGAAGLGDGRRRVLRSLRRNPLGLVGGGLLLIVVLVAVLAPVLAPYPPTQVHFDTPFQRIGTVGFWLGSDDLGRDTMSRVIYGTRASLEVGLLSVALAVVLGVPLGLVSGWWRTLDAFVARLTDLLLAFPFLILAVGLAAIRGPSLTNAALALGIAQVPTMIRVVRAETCAGAAPTSSRRPGPWTRAAAGSCSATSCRTPRPR